jgi:dipeptidyl aminopeptidase/acylaminoacyl peptidase
LLLLALACRAPVHERAKAAPRYAPLDVFPPLGAAKPVEQGIVVHEVPLGRGRIWVYLPAKVKAKTIPCVFIAQAGVPPIVGSEFGADLDRQRHPEHLPYVRAGFAVVAYDVDGALANPNDVTYEQVQEAATAFKNAEAGMVNARHAIDYVLKMVPEVDAARLYSAGHSSAGRLSLLLAESDPRIAACVAYAPVTDVERRVREIVPDAGRYLEANLPGFHDFLVASSPIRQVARLRCPVFLFHSAEDQRIDIAESETFFAALRKTNPRATFVRATQGDHYESMIDEGVPKAIEWLRALPRG